MQIWDFLCKFVFVIVILYQHVMEENLSIRLKLFIESLGISSSQFADYCGIPRPTLSQCLNGRNKKVSSTFVEQIHQAYPQLNIVWFLFGEGDMLIHSNDDTDVSSPTDANIGELQTSSSNHEEDLVYSPFSDSDILKFPHGESSENENSKENGLTERLKDANRTDNEIVELKLQLQTLQSEIENLRSNPRKVSQITIYYDDSTFETFLPSK